MSSQAILRDGDSDRAYKAKWWTSRAVIYAILIFWAIVCIFPIYWTITTSFKLQADVMKGSIVPWLEFDPVWNGWRSLGLSPEESERMLDREVRKWTDVVRTNDVKPE